MTQQELMQFLASTATKPCARCGGKDAMLAGEMCLPSTESDTAIGCHAVVCRHCAAVTLHSAGWVKHLIQEHAKAAEELKAVECERTM